jgi:RNA polymerase sigma-70 factor (ECF subfamily)
MAGMDAPRHPELLPLVYDELHGLARHYLRGERAGHTLQATALVNEAWLRMGDRSSVDRQHFLAIGAQAMRRVLVDHARKRDRVRRGGGQWQRVTLDEPLTPGGACDFDLVEMSDLLDALAERDARAAQVVELRFFGGLTIEETARVLDVSTGTVDNDWFAARAWLSRELKRGGAG